MTPPVRHRLDGRSRRVLLRFGLVLAWLVACSLLPGMVRNGSVQGSVAVLSTLCAMSGLLRMVIAVKGRERIEAGHLTSWDEAAAFYAMSILARMTVAAIGA